MTALFSQIWHAGLTAGFVVLAVFVLRMCFHKAPRWIAVALWGLVAVRLLCPVSFTSPVSVVPTLPEAVMFDAPTQTTETDVVVSSQTVAPEKNETANAQVPPTVPVEPKVTLSLETVAAAAWVCGVIGMLAYAVVSTARLRRRVRTATKLDGRVYESEAVSSPFILGVFRPKVYLPYGLDGAVKDSVIAHETAHLKRCDHLIKPLGFLLLSVYWFQPLLWVAYVCLCRDIEAACDEKAIKSLDGDARREYSYALVTLGVKDRRRIAACPLAFGEVGVKERVKRVMSYKKPTVWILAAALVLSSVAAVCLLTDRAPEEGGATLEGATLVISFPNKAVVDREEPLEENTSFTVRDHTPVPNKITIESVDERNLTVKVRFEREVYHNGKLTDTVNFSYDETVSLTAPMYEGKAFSYVVSVSIPHANDQFHYETTEVGLSAKEAISNNLGHENLTMYKAGETVLYLYDGWFLMLYGSQYDYSTTGTWEDDGETLTLTEDGSLTRQAFRRQADGSLAYDAKASYRHKKAKALELKNGDVLGFSFCYEVSESGIGNATRYDYAVKKADGTAWIEKEKAKKKPTISFVNDDVLCVRMDDVAAIGRYKAQKYINLLTGEVSKTYNAVVCTDTNAIAELEQNEKGQWGVKVTEFDSTCYTCAVNAQTEFFAFENVRDITSAEVSVRLDDKNVFFSYYDADGIKHIEAYVWTTRAPITQAVIVLWDNALDFVYDSFANGKDGAMYNGEKQVTSIFSEAENARQVYTVGRIRAAVYLGGEYMDLRAALKNGRISIDTLREKLREDAENGITGYETFRDGGTTIYHYGEDENDDVTVMNTLHGDRNVYIGEKVY